MNVKDLTDEEFYKMLNGILNHEPTKKDKLLGLITILIISFGGVLFLSLLSWKF